jgi:hypothetical protein
MEIHLEHVNRFFMKHVFYMLEIMDMTAGLYFQATYGKYHKDRMCTSGKYAQILSLFVGS